MSYNHFHDIDTGGVLEKIRPCPDCKLLPSLLTLNVWEFDYNRLEHLGSIRKEYQFICRGCDRHTPLVKTFVNALGYWNSDDSSGVESVLAVIRNGG